MIYKLNDKNKKSIKIIFTKINLIINNKFTF